MRHEVFCLCDAATESQGKLNILGAFDSVTAAQLPAIVPGCSVAIRIRVDGTEDGQHGFRIVVIETDGRTVVGPIEGTFGVRIGRGIQSASVNLVVNFQGIQLPHHGDYRIDMVVDGQLLCSVPLFVRPPA